MLKKYKKECKVCELTEEWTKGFYNYLLTSKNRKNKNYKLSSINKYMETLECYYYLAIKLFNTKVPKGSFDWYKYKPENVPIKALKDNDIHLLENYAATGKSKVIEQFLFMSYTGMRISDFENTTEASISREDKELWLTYTSIKTKTYTRLPLSSLFDRNAEKLICKYENKLHEFFCVGDNSAWNRKLNRHAKKAGIERHLTAHMARHTCATRLMEKNVPMTIIMKVLGHKKIDTTMIYAKITDNNLAKELLVS